jgi:hypothetical protein
MNRQTYFRIFLHNICFGYNPVTPRKFKFKTFYKLLNQIKCLLQSCYNAFIFVVRVEIVRFHPNSI